MSTASLTNFLQYFSSDSANSHEVNDINILNPLNTFTAEFHFYPSVTGDSLTSNKNFVTTVVANSSENSNYIGKTNTTTTDTSIQNGDKKEIEVFGSNDYIETRTQTTTTVTEKTESRTTNRSTDVQYVVEKNNDIQYTDISQNSTYNVLSEHNKFYRQNGKYSLSFMHYLTIANQMFSNNDIKSVYPLIVELGKYFQSITVPMIKIPDGKKSTTAIGEFSTLGQFVIPDNNTLQISIVNTRLPLIERIFYPWMREVTMPYWSYSSQPYTTATVIVNFNQHTDLKYIFCGCRPTQIQTIQPHQENDQSFQRTVTLLFDYMFITSNLKTKSDEQDFPYVFVDKEQRIQPSVQSIGSYQFTNSNI